MGKGEIASLAVAAALLTRGLPAAMAQVEQSRAVDVFTPSPPAAVQAEDIEEPLIDLNLTGRASDAFPRIDGSISIELQNDNTVHSDDKGREINDLTTSNDLFVAARLTPAFSLQAGLVMEDVKDPDPGKNRYLDDTGVFVETLGLSYQFDAVVLFGGKINPTFGLAWDLAPGIYGSDLADDYELTERIGLGGAVSIGNDRVGRHTLTAQTFYLDISVLSQSWGTQRGRTKKKDSGVSNTKSLESFSVTLDGDVPLGPPGLRYQLGGERQQRGVSDSDSEWGTAAALYGSFELVEDVDLRPIVEWALLKNREGEPNTLNYATAGVGLFLDAWNICVSYTGRWTDQRDDEAYVDRLFQVSAGYEFDNDISFNIGYAHSEDENVASDILGALLVYEFDVRIR